MEDQIFFRNKALFPQSIFRKQPSLFKNAFVLSAPCKIIDADACVYWNSEDRSRILMELYN